MCEDLQSTIPEKMAPARCIVGNVPICSKVKFENMAETTHGARRTAEEKLTFEHQKGIREENDQWKLFSKVKWRPRRRISIRFGQKLREKRVS